MRNIEQVNTQTEFNLAETPNDIDCNMIKEENIEIRRQLRHRRRTKMPKSFEDYRQSQQISIILEELYPIKKL